MMCMIKSDFPATVIIEGDSPRDALERLLMMVKSEWRTPMIRGSRSNCPLPDTTGCYVFSCTHATTDAVNEFSVWML